MPEMIQLTASNSVQELDAANLADVRSEAARLEQRFFAVQLDGAGSKEQVLVRIAGAFDFPDYFGHNLDALADCLTDLELGEQAGFVIVLEKLPQTAGFNEKDREKLLAVFRDVAEFWADQSVPFHVFYSVE